MASMLSHLDSRNWGKAASFFEWLGNSAFLTHHGYPVTRKQRQRFFVTWRLWDDAQSGR
jgi:hypothetical protein